MHFVNNLKVRTRVLAVAILPMLGLVGFGGYVLVEEYAAMTEAAEVRELVDVAPTISELVHQLQIERGRSAGFLGSDGDDAYRTAPARALREHRQCDGGLSGGHCPRRGRDVGCGLEKPRRCRLRQARNADGGSRGGPVRRDRRADHGRVLQRDDCQPGRGNRGYQQAERERPADRGAHCLCRPPAGQGICRAGAGDGCERLCRRKLCAGHLPAVRRADRHAVRSVHAVRPPCGAGPGCGLRGRRRERGQPGCRGDARAGPRRRVRRRHVVGVRHGLVRGFDPSHRRVEAGRGPLRRRPAAAGGEPAGRVRGGGDDRRGGSHRPGAGDDRGRLLRRAQHHAARRRSHRHDAGAGRRRQHGRRAGHGPARRDRRDGACRRGVQAERDRDGDHACRAGGAGGEGPRRGEEGPRCDGGFLRGQASAAW